MRNNNLELELNSVNIFDGLRMIVLSSANHPDYKVKCKGASEDLKSLVNVFEVRNLEFV